MKFKTDRETLIKTLQEVQNIVSTRATLPILSNILVDATKHKVTFVGTDLDVGITTSIDSEISEEGATTVPAKRFFDIVRELPDEEVIISSKKNNALTIDCSKASFRILGLPKEEFPKLPHFEEKDAVNMQQEGLKYMIDMTSFAISKDESRYVLNGTLFILRGKSLILVATDGRRLAVIQKDLPQERKTERRFIVPTKTIQQLSRLLTSGNVRMVLSENQILFDLGNTKVVSRLVEGEFPNYEQVIPDEIKEKIMVDRQNWLAATRRAALLTSVDSQAVRLDVFKDKMLISKQTPDIGEAKEEIDIEYKGNPFSIGFNPNYLVDVLKSLDGQTVEFELTGPDKPGVVRTPDGFTYVVLPMQL